MIGLIEELQRCRRTQSLDDRVEGVEIGELIARALQDEHRRDGRIAGCAGGLDRQFDRLIGTYFSTGRKADPLVTVHASCVAYLRRP